MQLKTAALLLTAATAFTSHAATLPFASTSDASAWQVATQMGGADGQFSSFPTTGAIGAVTIDGRTSDGVNWISNTANGSNACCTGNWTFFVFTQTFDLTGYDAASASLSFQWAADDSGEGFATRGGWRPKFSLNGGSLIDGGWAAGITYEFGPAITLSSGFVSGLNKISFYVEGNGVSDGMALRALTFTAAPVPEPATWGLMGAGLALGLLMRRRQRGH